MRSHGFTLLELLVAVAVFAVVAALAWGGLDTLARSRHAIDAESVRLDQLRRGIGRFERDLRQAAARTARSEGTAAVAALAGEGDRLELSVWLPSGGWSGPAPELQRVAWSCTGDALRRSRWPVVDRTLASPREDIDLVEGVSECRLRYYPARGNPGERWPPRGSAEVLPRAVELSFVRTGSDGGREEFRRLVELPQNPDPGP